MNGGKNPIKTRADLEVLAEIVVPKIKAAEKKGDGFEFGKLGQEYGPLAHELYMTHDHPDNPLCLPPYISINRHRDAQHDEIYPEDLEFWCHGDAILFLHTALVERGYYDACA